MGVNILSGVIFTPRKAGNAGYDLPAAEETAAAGAGAAAVQEEPLPVRLAKADPAKGQNAAKKCVACHDFTKGGPNKVGPNLYGMVGRPVAAHPGFNFSAALKAKGGTWTPEELDKFIHNPKKDVPGTIMAFAGIPSGAERADIIAYANTLSDNPAQLPKP
jgi:cytochrome c